MDAITIKKMGPKLKRFLTEFDDCFAGCKGREHLQKYVSGQLSDLPRKSVEPIALANGIPPRSLQRFLSYMCWDKERMRDRMQWLVARDHSNPRAIGIIDETGNPKKGRHTCGVKHQWCGNTGKLDNCVVAVHLAYAVDDFQCLLDSDLFLPKDWANDLVRRKEVGIPDDVVYRKKADIALEQVGRALRNGIRFSALSFDEFYGRDRGFLDGLDSLGQDYVGEVPSDFSGWVHQPQLLLRPTPQEMRKRGPKRRFPRLSRKALPVSKARNLVKHSRVFQKQKWQKFHIKDGEKGPIVWEVKHATFYRQHGENGLPGPAHCLIVARNVLNPDEIKYFISNMVPGSNGVTLKWLLWVAFSRWPIERCFELGKRDLGMDHFEVRSWQAIHRHLYISQLSQLFCARVHQQLREKNSKQFLPNGRTGPRRLLCVGGSSRFAFSGSNGPLYSSCGSNRVLSTPQPKGSKSTSQEDASPTSKDGNKNQSAALVCAT
jgi:SRSO17 transposase